jgi:hypothetical protein
LREAPATRHRIRYGAKVNGPLAKFVYRIAAHELPRTVGPLPSCFRGFGCRQPLDEFMILLKRR